MKKYILSLLALLAIVSCEGPMGPPGIPGADGTANLSNINLYVAHNMWEPVYDNNNLFLYYRYIAYVPELTKYIYNDGACIVYLKKLDGSIYVYEPLPAVIYNEESSGYLWEQTISCDFSPGEVAFYVKSSDFGDEGNVPPTLDFRVTLVWR